MCALLECCGRVTLKKNSSCLKAYGTVAAMLMGQFWGVSNCYASIKRTDFREMKYYGLVECFRSLNTHKIFFFNDNNDSKTFLSRNALFASRMKLMSVLCE